MNELDNAIQDFETFNATCVKDSWAGHNDLAWFYFRKGDIKKMRSTIEKIVDKNWVNPWVQNAYGIALLNDGEKRLAHEAFTRALTSANRMTEHDWGIAYPGNNPEIYGEGLAAMRDALQKNIELAE
jgi:tetratricopeptide (TPR) repeat protein